MIQQLQNIIEAFNRRLESSIEYNWKGGFEKEFLADWFEKILEQVYMHGYKAGLEDK